MRTITNHGDGKELETILIFRSQEEREEAFAQNKKELKRRHEEGIEKLRRAYLDGVSKVDEAYRRELGLLRVAEEKSLLETELPSIPESTV